MFDSIINFCKEHSSTILTVLAGAGVIATGITAANAAVKAKEHLEEADIPEDATLKEKAEEVWTDFIVPAAVGAATIACVCLIKKFTVADMVALGGSYVPAKKLYDKYSGVIKRRFGSEMHDAILDEIEHADQSDIQYECYGELLSANFDDGTDPLCLFRDSWSDRYFVSTKQRVLQGEFHFNCRHCLNECLSANDLYECLGIKKVPGGDCDILWPDSEECGKTVVYFRHVKKVRSDGVPYYDISTVVEPEVVSDPSDCPF